LKKIIAAILFFICTVPVVFGLDVSSFKPSGYVNDFAGIMDEASKQKTEALITQLQSATGAEIAVVTVKSLEGGNLEDFSNELFTKWGIGKKGKDNGVLIFVAYEDRRVRIETGYGIEGIINDAMAGRIISDNMAPNFRQNDYGGGIYAGTFAVASAIAAEQGVSLGNVSAPAPVEQSQYGYRHKMSKGEMIFVFILLIFMIPIVIRNPWLLLFFLGGGGGRNSGGGFGSGGFGGFGGGMSGGGGASGGW
jgi:uncharacterized protein